MQVHGATLEAATVAKTVALLRQLNQLTMRTATVCQGLFDDASVVQDRVAALSGRVKTAEAAAADLERARASGVRPIQELEYGGASPSLISPPPPLRQFRDMPNNEEPDVAQVRSRISIFLTRRRASRACSGALLGSK